LTKFGQLWVVGVCHLHARGNISKRLLTGTKPTYEFSLSFESAQMCQLF
jgi:hypothetical protein